MSEGGNEVQENGGNKEDDGSHEVDGNNITRWPEDQVQQPPEDFTISTDPELWGAITDHVREAAISQGPAAFQNRVPKYQHLCGTSVLEVKCDHLPMIYCTVDSQTTR